MIAVVVMPLLVPTNHVFTWLRETTTWMTGTRAGMTTEKQAYAQRPLLHSIERSCPAS
jgi:hypothetical protein